jgi:hypothetical protein
MARLSALCTLAVAVTATAITGCAAGTLETSAARGAAPATSRTVLTAAEIRHTRFTNAYDAVRYLRPVFLSSRGPTSLLASPRDDIVVIINGQVYGGLDELRTVSTDGIRSIRRLTAAEVYTKYGHSAPSGGIEVQLGACGPRC